MSLEPPMTTDRRVVGIDIAAKTFPAWWPALPRPLTFAQSSDGFATLCQRVQSTPVPANEIPIVMEATSTSWTALAVALHTAGVQVSVVHPSQIHSFARSLPRRAKNDALDAKLIAQFAQERHLPAWAPPPDIYHELRQPLQARDALLASFKQLRNQQHALAQWPVQVESVHNHLTTAIADLEDRITDLETEIGQ